MYRHLFIWLVAGLAALLLVPAALAVGVHVRVEGKTRNIFGSTEPTLTVKANALDALDSASLAGEFYYHVTATPSGRTSTRSAATWPGLERLGLQAERRLAAGRRGAVHAQGRGLSALVLGTFGPAGGPPTLVLQATKKRGCYRVLAQDDTGKTKAARGARLHAGSRSVLARTGGALPRGSQGPRDGDAHGRGALERGAVKRVAALAATLSVALAGCSSGTGSSGHATVWVTSDRGAKVLHTGRCRRG